MAGERWFTAAFEDPEGYPRQRAVAMKRRGNDVPEPWTDHGMAYMLKREEARALADDLRAAVAAWDAAYPPAKPSPPPSPDPAALWALVRRWQGSGQLAGDDWSRGWDRGRSVAASELAALLPPEGT